VDKNNLMYDTASVYVKNLRYYFTRISPWLLTLPQNFHTWKNGETWVRIHLRLCY